MMNPGVTALTLLLAAGSAAPAFAQPNSPPSRQSTAPAQASAQDEQNTVGEISEDVAMVRFQKLGYQNVDIGAWTRNGDNLEATATKNGQTYKVSIHVVTGAMVETATAAPAGQPNG